MLLGDNVITGQSRKRHLPVWAVNSCVTVLSLCSQTPQSAQDFDHIGDLNVKVYFNQGESDKLVINIIGSCIYIFIII